MMPENPYRKLLMKAVDDFRRFPTFREGGEEVPRTLDDVMIDVIQYINDGNALDFLLGMQVPPPIAHVLLGLRPGELDNVQLVQSLFRAMAEDEIRASWPDILEEDQRRLPE